MSDKEGWNATYSFFKTVCNLRLISQKRTSIVMWRLVREMLLKRINFESPN